LLDRSCSNISDDPDVLRRTTNFAEESSEQPSGARFEITINFMSGISFIAIADKFEASMLDEALFEKSSFC